MRNSFLFFMVFAWSNGIAAQSCEGFEQYFYSDKSGLRAIVPVVYFQNSHNWYVESHVNYEQAHTFSSYIGKTFSGNKKFSTSVTPMIGVVLGSLKGGVLGLNTAMNYKRLYFSSQAQYIFSFKSRSADFLYSWMELGYQVIGYMLVGFSIQHAMLNPANVKPETGLFIKFTAKKWNFPVYCFNETSENWYLILGVAREFNFSIKKTNMHRL